MESEITGQRRAPVVGVAGVMWIFAGTYVVAAIIGHRLRLPGVWPLR
jgi:hypothetical protein